MLVPFRHPVGIVVRGRDLKVERIRASSAPLVAAWTQCHGVQASATRGSFVIETVSAPAADGWYRLEVDRRAHRVTATCGADPAPGCVNGRWRFEDHGLVRRYLLGG